MKRISTIAVTLLLSLATASTIRAQATKPAPADRYSFDLTPAPIPTPALKYDLLFTDPADRLPGDSVPIYLQAMLLMPDDFNTQLEKADDAYEAGDMQKLLSLSKSVDEHPALYEQLELAARRDHCDWQPPFREMGVQTLLSHLNIGRELTEAIRIRALRQIQLGQINDALATLRIGYELAYKLAGGPFSVSGLVSCGIIAEFNDTAVQLMNRPDSPNLYWALAQLPPSAPAIRFDGDRLGILPPNFPPLPHNQAAEERSADQWRLTLTSIANVSWPEHKSTGKPLDPIRDASPAILRQARDHYARTHSLTLDQSANIDPAILLGTFYFSQYNNLYDDFRKLHNLPFSIQRPLLRDQAKRIEQLITQQPANPYLPRIPYANRAIETAARIDRQLAALTTVEALRSYASTHAGSLPPSLSDLTETPAPPDPMTGHPFDYTLTQNTATLSAPDDRYPLQYTIKIRQ